MRVAGPVAIVSKRTPNARRRAAGASGNRAGPAPAPTKKQFDRAGRRLEFGDQRRQRFVADLGDRCRRDCGDAAPGVARIEPTWLIPAKRKPPPP